MANAMRLPRRRSSVVPGIGSLEAESDIEDCGKRRKRIPLQRVAAMPIDAGIGTLPLAGGAVISAARLLDQERLKPGPEPLLLSLRHQVLAQRTRSRFGSELEKAPARRHRDALDRLHGLRGRDRREPGALAGRDPAAVDEDVELAPFELQRRQHVIAGSTVQHLVVEAECGARNETAARADGPALEGGRVQSHRRHRKHRAFGRFVEPAAELEFFFGAPRLPVAERNRERDESRRRDARCDPRTECSPADADSRHDFTRSTLGAQGSRGAVKIVVILLFVAILASLGSALFFLVTDGGQSKRSVKALPLRVGLSLALFLLLMAGYYFGLIPGKIE